MPTILAALVLSSWAALALGGGAAIFGWILITGLWPLVGFAAFAYAGVVSAWKRRVGSPRAVLLAVGVIAMWPGAWPFGVPGIAFPSSPSAQPALQARLPSDLPLRTAWGGPALKGNAHATSPGQRWAFDFVVEPAGHGKPELESYGCFGTPVLAPVAGEVHLAHDGEPDVAIGAQLSDPTKLLGNHVVLRLNSGTFLVLAHLKKGSVAVTKGARVAESQLLGACGNSGNTSEPHIHIHHQRQDPMLFDGDLNVGVNYVEGLPLTFRGQFGPSMPRGGVAVASGRVVFTGDVVRHTP